MAMPALPVRDDDRVERRRRRRALGRRRPRISGRDDINKDGIESDSDGVESDSESESEDESSTSQASVQTQAQPPPASSIAPPPPPAQTTSISPVISSTSVQAVTTSAAPPAPPPATTSLATSTSIAVVIPDPNTSIQGNRNLPPSSSESATGTLLTFSTTPSLSSTAIGVSNGDLISTVMTMTTATLLLSSPLPSSTTARGQTPANAIGEVSDSTSTATPSKNNGMSSGVETVIIVISSAVGIAFIVFLCLYFYRRYRRRQIEDNSNRSDGTRSLWGGSEASSGHGAPQMAPIPPNGPLPTYIPPITMQQTSMQDDNPFADPRRHSTLTNNAVERQERLGRVRADLLAPRELTGGLMRSATQRQANPPEPNRTHIRTASGNNIVSNVGPTGSGSGYSNNTVWPSGRVEANTMPPNARLDIEAGGQWDDSVTVARYSKAETEMSMPHWRTPSQWVKDQSKRSQGIERLPG